MPVAGGGPEIWGAQVHAPQHPGPDGVRLVRATTASRTPAPSELGVVRMTLIFDTVVRFLAVTWCNDMRKIAVCWTCGRTFWVWRLRERNFCSGKCRVRHHRSALRKPRPATSSRTPAGTG